MNDSILQRIDEKLAAAEIAVLEVFTEIRYRDSRERYATIDQPLQESLGKTLDELRHNLDHSGEGGELELTTERHELLRNRIVILNHLLPGQLPVAYIEEVNELVERASGGAPVRRRAPASATPPPEKVEGQGGVMSAFRKLFHSDGSAQDTDTPARPPPRAATTQAAGAYSAAEILAMVTSMMIARADEVPPRPKGRAYFESRDTAQRPETARDIAQSPEEIRKKLEARKQATGATAPAGSSTFEARELSNTLDPRAGVKANIALTPDEIRRKLESRSRGETSSFKARDLSAGITLAGEQKVSEQKAEATPAEPAPKPKPLPRATGPVAQTPEEIRKKLAQRDPTSAGKATFASKDIDNPNEKYSSPPPPRPDPVDPEPEPPRTGRAVFEARDPTRKD